MPIWNAYRQHSATLALRELAGDNRHAATPESGSVHHGRCAVSLTRVDDDGCKRRMPMVCNLFTVETNSLRADLPALVLRQRAPGRCVCR